MICTTFNFNKFDKIKEQLILPQNGGVSTNCVSVVDGDRIIQIDDLKMNKILEL